jgi:predicted nuclease of restriction endonuclease-like (RecB) superfamily
MQTKEYIKFISEIKENIIKSRYKAASLANKEMLLLYYYTGYKLSQKIKSSKWGNGVVSNISKDLQKELPGLRGFSFRNLQNMKQFYEEYELLQNLLLPSQDQSFIIMQSSTAQLKENEFMQLMTAQINDEDIDLKIETIIENSFLKIGFTHHITLINKCKDINERVFYFQKTIENQWSITILEHHINSKLFQLTGKIINNFDRTLPVRLHKHATNAFKSEYLLDFINLDEDDDERVLENEIVKNIKKFILSLGNDFSFIGNQYRVTVGEEEFFIDLLFFHRTLQSLIAFELKRGKFKAEYAGKMNLYLSALDEYVKKEHENPSIGIILCKEKDDKVIEFAFRDYNKAMGVAKLKTSREIPDKFKGLLPDIEELKKLI